MKDKLENRFLSFRNSQLSICFVIFWGQFLKFKVQLMYFYLIRFVDQWQIYKRVDWGKNGILILWKQRGNYWQKCLKTITIIAHKIFIFYVLSFHFTHFFFAFLLCALYWPFEIKVVLLQTFKLAFLLWVFCLDFHCHRWIIDNHNYNIQYLWTFITLRFVIAMPEI